LSSGTTKRFSDSTRRSSAQALEHRRGEQELAHVFGLTEQDLVEQEVGHVAVAAGEPLDEPLGVVAAP
jgi:hypothetical protein